MMSDTGFKRYLITLCISMCALFASVAVLNLLVDPYALFGVYEADGVNRIKPAAVSRTRVSKAHHIVRQSPDLVIAGNSRPEIGIDPESLCFSDMGSIYNASLAGSSVYMSARFIQHALAQGEVDRLLWGLDFKDFLHDGEQLRRWQSDHDEPFERRLSVDKLGAENQDYSSNYYRDVMRNLFSLDTSKDSLYTLMSQGSANGTTIRQDGYHPATHHIDIFRLEGQGLIFEQKNREIIRAFTRDDLSFSPDDADIDDLESLRRVLEAARDEGVVTRLFINPYHADYLLVIERSGRWVEFEHWKRRLKALADEYQIELWDFSGLTPMMMGSPPSKGDRKTILEWFWEPAHYRSAYGDLMLERMLGVDCAATDTATIGFRLDGHDIDKLLSEQRDALSGYMSEQTSDVQRIDRLMP